MTTNYLFSNHDTVALAEKYGTPLYVMSEDIIRENLNKIINAFTKQNATYDINYAGKAFLNVAMCNIIKDIGVSLDVVSGGELYTAHMANFPMERVCLHGNNKTVEEIKMAIDYNIGKVIVDSKYELELLNAICQEHNHVMRVSIRVSPGVEAHTHEFIQTGKIDSKFGIPLKQVRELFDFSKNLKNINIIGLHCHIGSQIIDEEPFLVTAGVMLHLMKELKEDGFTLSELNLGGGFAIPQMRHDEIFNVDQYIEKLMSTVRKICSDIQIDVPKIVVEPGRYTVGTAGITLYKIGTVKEIPEIRKYVSVDGGMTDNPRPALYGAVYDAIVANKTLVSEEQEIVTISGRCCESDTLIKDIQLAKVEPGDILAVLNTGAYNYAMSSNYNRIPRPAVVLLKGDQDEIIVRRETYEDIAAKDMLPSWQK